MTNGVGLCRAMPSERVSLSCPIRRSTQRAPAVHLHLCTVRRLPPRRRSQRNRRQATKVTPCGAPRFSS